MKKIFLLFSLLCSINIYSQRIGGIYVNETDISFSIYEEKNKMYDLYNNKLSKFKVNNEKTYIFSINNEKNHIFPIEKEYSFENDSLILKLKHIQEKSKKWFLQSIELEISDFTKTISDDKYGKFNFYCAKKYFRSSYKVYWFLDDMLIATFESNNELCSINEIIEKILCVNTFIEKEKEKESIELKKQKEKQEKIDLLL